ncbi:unnamed protein product, partial [Nesidiocoris tenuis]
MTREAGTAIRPLENYPHPPEEMERFSGGTFSNGNSFSEPEVAEDHYRQFKRILVRILLQDRFLYRNSLLKLRFPSGRVFAPRPTWYAGRFTLPPRSYESCASVFLQSASRQRRTCCVSAIDPTALGVVSCVVRRAFSHFCSIILDFT